MRRSRSAFTPRRRCSVLDLHLSTFEVDEKALKKIGPSAADFDTIVDEECDAWLDGEAFAVVRHISKPEELLSALRTIDYRKDYRTSGLYSQSRIFGYRPREPVRKDFCAAASIAHDDPTANRTLCDFAEVADTYYRQLIPATYAKHAEVITGVRPEWRINDTLFTSGIANKDNVLGYHKDHGNFSGAWSAMFAIQKDIGGGFLVMPKHRVAFSFKRPSIILFNGATTLHGVTPLRRTSVRSSYRYTVVYYSLKMMCNCGSRDEELSRIRKVKTDRERRRVKS
jgi:hypothetical protein